MSIGSRLLWRCETLYLSADGIDLRRKHMRAYLERRTARTAGWSRRLAGFSAVLFIVAGLAHRYGLLQTPVFLLVLGLVAALAICALAFSAFAFSRVWNNGDVGGSDLTWGAIIALAVLVPYLITGYRGVIYPQLNDISTDLDEPPALTQAAKERTADMDAIVPFTPERRKLQSDKYPDVTGRRYDLPFDRAFEGVEAVVKQEGWKQEGPRPHAEGQSEVTVEALAFTTILAFPVDVSIRLIDEGETTYVDMRSTSRYGKHDFGDNAARITEFFEALDTEVATLSGTAPVIPAP
jgi:hypothetical protein